jgi:soluble lytic murein transglycosylase-like protein
MVYKRIIVAMIIVMSLSTNFSNAFAKGKGNGSRNGAKQSALSDELTEKIVRISRSYGLDPMVALELIRVESGFHVNATSNKGAQGLCQFIPSTAYRFGVNDPYDAEQAIHGCCRLLVYLLRRYNGRLDLALAAYNAGEKRVEDAGMKVPNIPETINYVRTIMLGYKRATELAARYRSPARQQIAYGSSSSYELPARPLSNKELRSRIADLDNQMTQTTAR